MEELEKNLNYNFKNKNLLKRALTHPSCNRENYERLEFLGDSILAMIITEYLFNKYQKEKEGDLSKRKSYLVSKEVLFQISNSLNIGKFIIMSKGEEHCGGRNNINNLENVLEAIIAAIYLDSGIEKVREFILNVWIPIDLLEKKPHKSPKTELQEWSQKYHKSLPEYILLKTELIDNIENFYIKLKLPNGESIEGVGKNIKKIEEDLAKQMLEKIKN